MRRTESWIMIGMLTSIVGITAVKAQQKDPDSLLALKEFAHLGQMYHHPSVRLMIHMEQTSNLPTRTTDSLQTDMDLYYGKPDFYMNAEGLEEISNDSVLVMVNRPAKRMIVSRHDHQVSSSIERTISMFVPDSSIQALAKRYNSTIENASGGKKQLTLTSRELVYGTDIPRETVRAIYSPSSYDLVEFKQIKTSLVPVDAAVFDSLQKEQAYRGKLVSSSTNKGKLFFLTKQLTIACRFDKIDYELKRPPVTEADRIERMADGNYKPAKGFEEYILTDQF
ncbi:MAG: hypothetical protein J0H74_23640 [Chitinophagaceae bacterium]|nr:hypothetical protein [Chitinophagaceae bacterium]